MFEDKYLFYRRSLYQKLASQVLSYYNVISYRITSFQLWKYAGLKISDGIDIYENNDQIDQIDEHWGKQKKEERLRRVRTDLDNSLVFGLRPGCREIFETCRKHGITVIVLDIPINSLAKRIIRGEKRLRYMNDKLAELEREGLIKRINGPDNLSEDDFIDLRHMNKSGREKYSRWLVKKLQELRQP